MDSPFANHAFAEKNNVTFPLLGDQSGAATKEYGLFEEKDIKGAKLQFARRATFLIGKDGKIEEMQVDNEAVDPTKIVTVCERKKKAS